MLSLTLQATVSPDDLIENPDFEDIISSYNGSIEVIQVLREEVLDLTQNQVDYHDQLEMQRNQLYEFGDRTTAGLGYVYSPQVPSDPFSALLAHASKPLDNFQNPTITATSITGVGLDSLDLIEYPGFNAAVGVEGPQPIDDVVNYLALQAQKSYDIAQGYSSEPTTFTITIPSVYGHEEQVVSFDTGYGIGNDPS